MGGPGAAPGRERRNDVHTGIFLFLAFLGRAMLLVTVVPTLLLRKTDDDEAEAAQWTAVWQSGLRFLAFLAQPAMGHVTDRVGRKPMATATQVFVAIAALVLGFEPPLEVMLVVLVLSGAYDNLGTVASAIVADWRKRSAASAQTQSFGMLLGLVGLSVLLGAGVGSGLNERYGPGLACFVAAGLHLAALVYLQLFCDETNAEAVALPESSVEFCAAANPFPPLRLLYRVRGLRILLPLFMAAEAILAVSSLFFFILDHKFDWGTRSITAFLVTAGLLSALTQIVGIPRIVPRVTSPAQAVLVSSLVTFVGFLAFAFSPVGWAFFIILLFVATIGSIGLPSLRGLMTSMVPPEQQGALQGALQGTGQLVGAVMSLVYAGAFRLGTSDGFEARFGGSFGTLPLLLVALVSLALFLGAGLSFSRLHDLDLLDADSKERHRLSFPCAVSGAAPVVETPVATENGQSEPEAIEMEDIFPDTGMGAGSRPKGKRDTMESLATVDIV